jgi:hypothetical protein
MPRLPLRIACLLALAAGLGACDAGGPPFVYVPGPGFQRALVVRLDTPADGPARTGEWITLHANRLMGPWQRVRRAEAPDSALCVLPAAPASPEIEIASKLQWHVEPAEGIRFNRPNAPDYERQIQFTRPGTYRVWAVSDRPCREAAFASDTVVVVVE